MSFMRMAARLALVQALKGATYAGDRVYDSLIGPLDRLAVDERVPVIVVTTDEDRLTVKGRDLNHAVRKLDIVIETSIASVVRVDGDDFEVTIPNTDDGLEITLDLMGRQVARALSAPGSEWAEIFRTIVPRFDGDALCRRGADATTGARFAARQFILTVDTLNEPPFGPAGTMPIMERFLTAVANTPELAQFASLFRAEIEAPDLLSWQREQAGMALTLAEFRTLGIAPIFDPTAAPGDVQEAPPVAGMVVDGLTLDQGVIDGALPPEEDDGV